MSRLDQLKAELAAKRGTKEVSRKEQLPVRVERAVRGGWITYQQQRVLMLIDLETMK